LLPIMKDVLPDPVGAHLPGTGIAKCCHGALRELP